MLFVNTSNYHFVAWQEKSMAYIYCKETNEIIEKSLNNYVLSFNKTVGKIIAKKLKNF